MISDRNISATTVASLALWAIGGVFVVVGYSVDLWFTGVGLWLSGIGGVLSVRRMFCDDSSRQRSAFDLGRDYERSRELHLL